MKTIYFWGTPPPPIGGMNVHIERLAYHLSKKKWNIIFFNFSNYTHNFEFVKKINNLSFWYLSLFFYNKKSIHYVITTRTIIRFLASLLVLSGQKVILREGGRDLQKSSKSSIILNVINILSLKLCTNFIGVNKEICDFAKKYKSEKKVFHINGFIYPPDLDTLPPDEIISFFGDSNLRFVTCGQVVSSSEEDIYGLWSIIPLVKSLTEKNIDIKLCLVSYNYGEDNTRCRNEYKKSINDQGISKNILFYHSNIQLWPILKYSNFFIRSAITDGDSNAVREALVLNNTVFCSDCVERPKHCITYKTNDNDDLIEKILTFIEGGSKKNKNIDSSKNEDKIESLLINLNTN
jgi:hypothetical protein